MMTPPTFSMPACHRHFFKGHKWWCVLCDVETERQFREVCEAWWARNERAVPVVETQETAELRETPE